MEGAKERRTESAEAGSDDGERTMEEGAMDGIYSVALAFAWLPPRRRPRRPRRADALYFCPSKGGQ